MKPLDILIAEDSKVNQMVLKTILEKAGHRVTVVDNGHEAVNIIEQQQIPFNLVLMDMSMPILCGIEATKQIRKNNFNIPVIAITANAMNEDREKCIQAGMNDFLIKPIRATVLHELLKKHVV